MIFSETDTQKYDNFDREERLSMISGPKWRPCREEGEIRALKDVQGSGRERTCQYWIIFLLLSSSFLLHPLPRKFTLFHNILSIFSASLTQLPLSSSSLIEWNRDTIRLYIFMAWCLSAPSPLFPLQHIVSGGSVVTMWKRSKWSSPSIGRILPEYTKIARHLWSFYRIDNNRSRLVNVRWADSSIFNVVGQVKYLNSTSSIPIIFPITVSICPSDPTQFPYYSS